MVRESWEAQGSQAAPREGRNRIADRSLYGLGWSRSLAVGQREKNEDLPVTPACIEILDWAEVSQNAGRRFSYSQSDSISLSAIQSGCTEFDEVDQNDEIVKTVSQDDSPETLGDEKLDTQVNADAPGNHRISGRQPVH